MSVFFSEIYRQVNADNSDNTGTTADTSNDARSEEQQRPARPRMALVVVDVQGDFSMGGVPAIDGAEAAHIATYLHVAGTANKYSVLATTRDNHIGPGTYFSETPDLVDIWSKHCIAGTPGAEIHPGMQRAIAFFEQLNPAVVCTDVIKGEYAAVYSGFEGTTEAGVSLTDALRAPDIEKIDVVGAAIDHYVCATVLDGLKEDFFARAPSNQVATVGPECGKAALAELAVVGATVVQCCDVDYQTIRLAAQLDTSAVA